MSPGKSHQGCPLLEYIQVLQKILMKQNLIVFLAFCAFGTVESELQYSGG